VGTNREKIDGRMKERRSRGRGEDVRRGREAMMDNNDMDKDNVNKKNAYPAWRLTLS
jgi:hypothetical protein